MSQRDFPFSAADSPESQRRVAEAEDMGGMYDRYTSLSSIHPTLPPRKNVSFQTGEELLKPTLLGVKEICTMYRAEHEHVYVRHICVSGTEAKLRVPAE